MNEFDKINDRFEVKRLHPNGGQVNSSYQSMPCQSKSIFRGEVKVEGRVQTVLSDTKHWEGEKKAGKIFQNREKLLVNRAKTSRLFFAKL